MKKSTIIIILIVYLASIIVVGFFGMRVKVYDKVKYIKSIEVTAKAESEEMYSFTDTGLNSDQNHTYKMLIFFTKSALTDNEGNKYLSITLMPKVTYDSGDIAGESEKIEYEIVSSVDVEKDGKISLSEYGLLTCRSKTASFDVVVRPVGSNLQGSQAIISVYVF